MRLIVLVILNTVLTGTYMREGEKGIEAQQVMVHIWRDGGGNKKKGREGNLLIVSTELNSGVEKRENGSVVTKRMCIVRQKLWLSFDMIRKLLSPYSRAGDGCCAGCGGRTVAAYEDL